MILKRFGLSCFALKAHDTTLILDPFNPKIVGIPLPVQEADMVLYSDASSIDEQVKSRVQASPSRVSLYKQLLEIIEPGEYEVGGIFVQVFSEPEIVVINIDSVNICYVGLGKKLQGKLDFESLPTIDYLIVPVGDNEMSMDWKVLDVVLREIEPGIVIPSMYREEGMKGPYANLKSLQEFAEKFGAGEVRHEKKLKLQNIVLGEEETYEVIALDAA